MIKVFIPQDKTQGKTNVRGLWVNNKGILFYDYLAIKSGDVYYLEDYKIRYNQQAIFYTSGDIGYIYYSKDKIDVLPKVLRFNIGKDRANLKGLIKRLLRDYKGLTIYTEPEGYLLEVYYNEGII
jgi:hypothetical protein